MDKQGDAANRQPWRKPELIVLTRSRPEEAVLTFCKLPTRLINIKQKPRCTANACKANGGS